MPKHTWLLTFLFLSGCVLTRSLPAPSTTDERLAVFPTDGLPLEGTVHVYWDPHQIPYVQAETDDDAAYVLGLIHAHLRLGQMELIRRAARGRLSEMGGPFATEVDHLIRILDIDRAVPQIVAALPSETRRWVDRFVAGINHYVRTLDELPHEFKILQFEVEPWTVEDVFAIGRLASADVNWIVWLQCLNLLREPGFESLWTQLTTSESDMMSFTRESFADPETLMDISRSGSNSIVVSGARTKTGAALMANDPHLGVQQPNFWMIAGVKSPKLHAVGFMVPGVPVFALGRNRWIAWGGTNMRSASSDLVDISHLPESELRVQEQPLSVRWWFDTSVEVRESPYGPVFSDIPFLEVPEGKRLALRWVGHTPSDELSALLAVNQATNFVEFRNAFNTYSVAGQNYLYADTKGNIGQVLAVRLPERKKTPPAAPYVSTEVSNAAWDRFAGPTELPSAYNPEPGFIVSANNKPTDADRPIGFFFAGSDRVTRLAELVDATPKHTVSSLQAIQGDVFMRSALRLKEIFVKGLSSELEFVGEEDRRTVAILRDWDGYYHADKPGPVVFEVLMNSVFEGFVSERFSEAIADALAKSAKAKEWLADNLDAAPFSAWREVLFEGLGHSTRQLRKYPTWGDMHRLSLAHPLSFAPLIGGRYVFRDLPVSGSTDTILKSAHGRTNERHTTQYGAQARHISDLSDPNENFFVLLGGQDGWLRSENFLDQAELFSRGELIRVPLEVAEFAKHAAKSMRLTAAH